MPSSSSEKVIFWPARTHEITRPELASLPSAAWLALFLLIEIGSQLLLLVVDQGLWRVPLRISAYAASLALAVIIPNRVKAHPAAGVAMLVIAIYALSLLNPGTRLLPGIAQVFLTAAVVAPLFWTPRLAIDMAALKRLLGVVWILSSLSSGLGILQVYYPSRFEPNFSETLKIKLGGKYNATYVITNAKGERAQRPMGLTDAPGGAAPHGTFATLIGLAGLLMVRSWASKVVILVGVIAGSAVVFLSQVRMYVVMLGVSVIVLLAVTWMRGDRKRVVALILTIAMVVVSGFWLAYWAGGDAMANRMRTLIANTPSEVYYANRGEVLETSLKEDLPRYPFGAGLGRWGMTYFYFASADDVMRPMLWAEVQWTGWIYDGGIPLVLAYSALLFIACATLWRFAGDRSDLGLAAALISGYTLAAIAATFCSPIFHSQVGMDVWMLNGALFAAARTGSCGGT